MEKEKRTYFKLGPHASVFSDNTNRLKVTKHIPGSTLKPDSKQTKEAAGNGHIIEISKIEFDEMMSKRSDMEKKMAYKEQGIILQTGKPDQEEDEDNGNSGVEDDEREELLKTLSKMQMPKGKRAQAKEMSTPDLKAFIEDEQGK